MTGARLLAAIGLLVGLAVPALAEPCRSGPNAAAKRGCATTPPGQRRFEPYDPTQAVRAGRTPGFIDLGNGTEVRISGRARMDYDLRR